MQDTWKDEITASLEGDDRDALLHLARSQTARLLRYLCGRLYSDSEAEMYGRAMELLGAHGYAHYEVSNFALPGFRCRHNCNYWSHEDYLGFGPSAHSFWKESDATSGRRWWNVADLSTYQDRLRGGSLAVASEEHVGTREMINERIFLGLRSSGLDLASLTAELDYDLEARRGDRVRWLIEERLASLDGGILRLTSKGYLQCDEICRRLLP